MEKINKIMRVFMVTLVIFSGVSFSNADPSPGIDPVLFQVGWRDPSISHGELPRGPITPPSASLDDHTLYIEGEHPAYMLYLVDNSGEEPDVVYHVYVPANVGVVYLPATLTGTFELDLYNGGQYYFYSEIEL